MSRPPKGTPTKSDFVRKLPFDLSAAEVIAQAATAGFTLTPALVHKIRGRARAAEKKGGTPAQAAVAPKAAAKAAAPKAAAPKASASKRAAKPAAAGKWANGSDFVRAQPVTRSVAEIVAEGKSLGLKVSGGLVYNIRAQLKHGKGKPAKAAPKAAVKTAAKAAPKAKGKPGRPSKKATPAAGPVSASPHFRKLVLELGFIRAKALIQDVSASLRALLVK